MDNIELKSIATLIDELITTSMKCWFAQEKVMSSSNPDEVAKAAKEAQSLNARRNRLIRAIDSRLGEESITLTGKTYE